MRNHFNGSHTHTKRGTIIFVIFDPSTPYFKIKTTIDNISNHIITFFSIKAWECNKNNTLILYFPKQY